MCGPGCSGGTTFGPCADCGKATSSTESDPLLCPDHRPKLLSEYASAITKTTCTCGATIPSGPENIEHYPHEGGWRVVGMRGRQWLFIHCRACGYDWALWKLGVPR